MKRTTVSGIFLVGMLLALLSGVAWMIHLRFERGDAYPRGSSMRADPLGAKALYESYGSLSRVSVERNYEPFSEKDRVSSDSMLLLLNLRGGGMHRLAHHASIYRFVSSGGRLVVALNPDGIAYKYLDQEGEFLENDESSEEPSDPSEVAESDDMDVIDNDEIEGDKSVEETGEEARRAFARRSSAEVKRFWGELTLLHGEHEGGDALRTEAASQLRLPAELPWREGGVLAELSDEWVPLYQIGEEVVVAERPLGRGSIVVMTDDYLYSNEALLKHRYVDLLAWSLGDKTTVIFDETHLGVAEGTGIALLMRRYRLGGFFLGFACLVALVVWRGTSPLLPPHVGRTKGNVVLAEHSTEAGMSDLVRRSVPASELPIEAFRQWKKSFLRSAVDERTYAEEIEAVDALIAEYGALPTRKRNPRELHSKIQTIMNRKKRKQL